MNIIDLRSDTVTRPTEEMREKMASAEVGDDVYGEDPTVNRLEEESAAVTGHEAGLFVTSGTQGNLVALLTHCSRGDGAILGSNSHIYIYEGGGLSAMGGVLPLIAPDTEGIVSPESIDGWCRPSNVHFAPARLLCLENTHNRAGGVAVSVESFGASVDMARSRGLSIHLDGARVFNAAVARGVDVKEYTARVDSVQFCLSKGLGAPVGSMLCGSSAFIGAARHWRKRLGGGLRQAGVIAAAGLVALDKMTKRLGEDHANADLLSRLLTSGGLSVEKVEMPTNMVYVSLDKSGPDAETLAGKCASRGILFGAVSERRFRLVTHFGITSKDVESAARIILEELKDS
ncbi:MAG TPA: low-specificity L-threonine aldolase [Synergistales bacterium]|jgi:threonine aldolase|nr:low-specificity L-threonine aldolase [Synergistales bacterium]HRV71593.1 low-specificity L-threonine aldolase [Thermovirgaceae bacterium]